MYRKRQRTGVYSTAQRIMSGTAARVGDYFARRAGKALVKTVHQAGVRSRKRAYSRKKTRNFRKGKSIVLRYQTRGYHGKFRVPRGVKFGVIRRLGTQTMVEHGGVVSGPDACYIGHGVPGDLLFTEVCRAITKRLMARAGFSVVSMGDKLQDDGTTAIVSPGTVHINYRTDENNPVGVLTFLIGADATYDEVADSLKSQLNTLLSASIASRPVVTIDEISFWQKDSASGTMLCPAARISMSNAKIGIRYNSKLHVQNRTLAGSAGTTDQTSMLDIANNPVDGKVYGGWGAGLQQKFADNAFALSGTIVIGSQKGVCGFAPSLANNWTQEMYDIYRRPPSQFAFQHCTKSASCSIAPGQIKTSFLNWSKTYGFNSFMQKNRHVFYSYTQATNARHNMGPFRVYGLEKRCNTTVDEPDISLGYEVNHTISVCIMEKPTVTARDVVVV